MSPAEGPLRELARVGVGSTNPPKIAGVRAALAPYAPCVSVHGVAVESGVSEQPVGFEEIVRGARARARAASAQGDSGEPFDLAVGYEDGLVRLPTGDAAGPEAWFNLGCAAVQRGGDVRLGFSSGFAYPPVCAERAVAEQEPIGGLFDALWNESKSAAPAERETRPSALGLGNVGKLTGGVVDRAEYTRHAVVCALTAFLHPELYAAGAGA